MKIGKRLLAIALVLTICVSMLNSFSVTAYAASIKTYSTMDAIPEDLDIFNTMAKGTISAVKDNNGVWYYQFTRSGYDTIRVKASAFAATTCPTNAYLADDNAALTKSVNSTTVTRNDYRFNYYVATKKSTKTVLDGAIDVYTTARWRSKLSANGATSDKIMLICELTNYVKFTYSSKVLVDANDYERNLSYRNKYVTPANAYEYGKALARSSAVDAITPNIGLSITNTGDLGAYLSGYQLSAKGSAATGINVSDLISLGYKTAKLAVSATPSNLYSLIKDVAGLTKSSSVYSTGGDKFVPLSVKNQFVYNVKYVSPIKLITSGDYLQVTIDFANSKSGSSGRGTAQLKVVFSFS